MAEDSKVAVGAVQQMAIRRIGATHAVILPPREAKLVDVAEMRREVLQITRRLAAIEEERAKLEAIRADRTLIIDSVDAAKIDRVDGDPDVPQPLEEQPVLDAPGDAEPAPAPVSALRGG